LQHQITTIAYFGLRLADLTIFSLGSSIIFDSQLFSRAISCFGALALCGLSYVEHRRAARPSNLLVLYVLSCLLGHAIELFMLLPSSNSQSLSFLFATIILELAVLAIESHTKEAILLPRSQQLAPEELEGILGRTFFWWINPILLKGYRSILTDADLPHMEEELSSLTLRRKVQWSWDQRGLSFY
jgi:ATP-binding cassette subfamily C (CFTR/MRP) protein 1